MPKFDPLAANEAFAVQRFIQQVTLPLILNSEPYPAVLGTGTLFRSEGRVFLVTAAHILRKDPDNYESHDIDFTAIAFPSRMQDAQLQTLGTFDVLRPQPPSKIDVAVLELKTPEAITILQRGWRFLGFNNTGSASEGARVILTGYIFEGVRFDGVNIGQKMLTLSTDRLHYTPEVKYPEPTVDQFYYLQDEGEQIDGSIRPIPDFQGLSGASIWSYIPSGKSPLWEPSLALHVIGVQSSFMRGKWFRATDWIAVKAILQRPEVGLNHPPR